jgi:hypothetical protein
MLKLLTTVPEEWVDIPDWENKSSSGLLGLLYEVIPLKPLEHPVNELVVIPLYVTISLPIWSKP